MANEITGIIFDLWNTLVPLSNQLKSQAFKETSRVLGFEPTKFKVIWDNTRTRRETGDLLEYFYWLRNEIGADWSEDDIQNAMMTRRSIHGSAFLSPDSEAIEVLSTLQSYGYRIALVSNCSSDVKEMILSSDLGLYIPTLVLSAEVGIMKPDERVFQYAASQLGLSCGNCLYIGDGHDNELMGAERAGMKAILIDRCNGINWGGIRVNKLSSVLTEVGIN